ncbi:NFX1-type zinc finger-containing protein 1 [Holothuria leucospilota]|uniref:NFX1-type zinc finger-containing protein 1 n=1 Tax=Holothuria leucospilota TaxID=206669 RepID=A0A9Q1CC06_HOLLE|nr:NFX1-type zinc finger-containing protein 1 [Holothuria leucospilota]
MEYGYSVRNLAPDRPISWADLLKKLQTADLPEVILRLNDTGNGLARLLDRKLNEHVLQLLVCLLSRICNGDQMSSETTNIVTVLHEKRFLESNITPWLGEWTAQNPAKDVLERNLEAIVSILIKLLHEIPDSVSSIGTALLIMRKIVREREDNNNTICFNLSAKMKTFMEEHEKYQRDSHEMALCTRKIRRRQPPNNFRYLPILPMTHELRSTHKPFLRAVIVNGKYENVHHYLDVHFRLLREDFMKPLRDGIAEYVALLPRHRFGKKLPLQNISLYERVSVKFVKLSQEGLIYEVNFQESITLKKFDWETCKRLLPGSLVCLSPDDFQTLICGIIRNRDPNKLALGVIEVIISHERLPSYDIFKMVEPQSYFESYRHVLSSLQTMNEDTFPLQQYLVSGLTKPHLPKYIADNPQMPGFRIYADFEKGFNNRRIINCRRVKVGDDTGWPTASQLGLDASQMEAFQAALREEVCVIQGPPGTGKTFLGLKVVETLLINKTKWSTEKPLLVVCYTNHALDQFLNGILKFERNVIRLGKRSTSETVQKYNIDVMFDRGTLNDIKNVNSCRDREYHPTLEKYKDILNMARHKLLNISSLELVMGVAHQYSLRYSKEEDDDRKDNGNYKGPNRNAFLKTVFPKSKVQNVFKLTFTEHPEENDFFISEEELTDYYDCHCVMRHQTTLKQLIQTKLLQNDAISIEQAEMVTDVWSLDLDQRWRLYKLWQKLFIEKMQKKLEWLSEKITERENSTKEIHEIAIRRAFRRFSVIGATTTGAAKNSALLQILGPPIVVVEEAAEILEAHVITALSSSCQHLILIGDHQQLRPSVEVYELCKDYKLDVSLFERLVMNGMPCHRLVTQHRMRPEISHLLKIHKDFYPDLKDHDTVAEYEDVWGIDKNLFFIDHSFTEDLSDNAKSRSNYHEATFLYALFKYLLKQGYSSSQITILTAYRGQVRTFSQIMEGKHFREARVCPIDNFQGEENDIILFSFVRSNEEGNIGFLKVSNRICVAFSRARKGLYCIGNFTLMSKQNPLWKAIINDLHKRKCIGPHLKLVCRNHSETFTEVSVAEDFRRVPDGGCSEPCNARLNCGHTCQKACHPEDKEHRKVSCKKPCENVMCEQRHICPLICGADCGSVLAENARTVDAMLSVNDHVKNIVYTTDARTSAETFVTNALNNVHVGVSILVAENHVETNVTVLHATNLADSGFSADIVVQDFAENLVLHCVVFATEHTSPGYLGEIINHVQASRMSAVSNSNPIQPTVPEQTQNNLAEIEISKETKKASRSTERSTIIIASSMRRIATNM